MAKITVLGDCFVLTSSISIEDMMLIQKFRPDDLKILDEETRETRFAISFGTIGSLNNNGICFDGSSNDEAKRACLTAHIPRGTEDKVEYVRDLVGHPMLLLERIESRIADSLSQIKLERDEINSRISVM